jgi:hypothetical protein
MMKFRHCALFASMLVAAQAHAAVDVYSQPAGSGYADVSAVYNYSADPGFTWTLDSDMQAWAYFSLPSDVKVNAITWYGSDSDGQFAVDLFPATCFSCALSFVTTSGSFTNNLLKNSAYSAAQVQKTALGGGLFAYSISLPTTLTLSSASPAYGFSVVNNYTGLPFQWSASGSGSGVHAHYIVGQAVVLKIPGNLAFTLTDTQGPVPEAGSAALMLAGLGSLIAVRRRLARP